MTRLGLLTVDLLAGHVVRHVTDAEVARLCHDFAGMTPPRWLMTWREEQGSRVQETRAFRLMLDRR